jgi:phosphatidylglycerol:prolipoprotein diacylglycerol transferase
MSFGFAHDFDKAFAHLFGLPLYWYGAVYTVGFLGVFGWFALRRSRLGLSMADVLDLCIAIALGVLIGGRVFDILVYELDYYRDHALQVFDWWRGGLATHGVLLGALVSVQVFCKLRGRPFLQVADELTVPAAFLLAVGRLGNFMEGGVIGTATELPWAVHYADLEGARHPVALYESAKNLLLVPVLVWVLRRHPAGRGTALALFVFLYAMLRFWVDLLRDYEAYWLGLDTGQYFNLMMACVGLALLVWAMRRGTQLSAGASADSAAHARVGLLRAVVFACLCLYPLGIPTSWTQTNIEEKRQNEPSAVDIQIESSVAGVRRWVSRPSAFACGGSISHGEAEHVRGGDRQVVRHRHDDGGGERARVEGDALVGAQRFVYVERQREDGLAEGRYGPRLEPGAFEQLVTRGETRLLRAEVAFYGARVELRRGAQHQQAKLSVHAEHQRFASHAQRLAARLRALLGGPRRAVLDDAVVDAAGVEELADPLEDARFEHGAQPS